MRNRANQFQDWVDTCWERDASRIEQELDKHIEETHLLNAIELIVREVNGVLSKELDKETRLRLLMAQQCVLDAKESYENAR